MQDWKLTARMSLLETFAVIKLIAVVFLTQYMLVIVKRLWRVCLFVNL